MPPSEATGEHKLRLMTETVAIAFIARTGQLHEPAQPAAWQAPFHYYTLTIRRLLSVAARLR
jgi:hypothetical protein